MIHLLSKKLEFPDPATAEPDGLLAIGGDLKPERLLLAYSLGIFPWFSEDEFIMWFSPHKRFVLFPQKIKISRSMQQVMRSGQLELTVNKEFDAVVNACAAIQRKNQAPASAGQAGTWITEGMKNAYSKLHAMGHAHSIEVWKEGELAGGLYGVQVGKVFCGESMFSKRNNASKAALIHLATRFSYSLIDCQVYTAHLASMGAEFIPAREYKAFLPLFPPK